MRVNVISDTVQEFNGERFYLSGKYFRRKGKLLHRVVWTYHHGVIPPKHHVHHVTGDTSRNQVEDLAALPGGAHLSMHLRTPERAAISRKAMDRVARPAAAKWHGSEAGREWHREHHARHIAPRFKETVERTCDRPACGKVYATCAPTAAASRFCSNACKSAARRDSGVDDEQRACVVCLRPFTVNKYREVRTCSPPCRTALWRRSKGLADESRYQVMAAAPSTVSTKAVGV